VGLDQFAELVEQGPKSVVRGHRLNTVHVPPEVKLGFVPPGQVVHRRFQMSRADLDSHYASPFTFRWCTTADLHLRRPPLSRDDIPDSTLRFSNISKKPWDQVNVQMNYGLTCGFSDIDADVIPRWLVGDVQAVFHPGE